MIKRFGSFMTLLVVLLLAMLSLTPNIQAQEDADMIYFGSKFCVSCARVEAAGVFDSLANQGFVIQTYYLEDDAAYLGLLRDYQEAYGLPLDSISTPIIFVGEESFAGEEDILTAFNSGRLVTLMTSQSLLAPTPAPLADFRLISFILLGLVDSINPCAIAMLLMFISLLNFSTKKRVIISVAFTYIGTIFASYFLFGTILYRVLTTIPGASLLVQIVPWVIIILAAVLLVLNGYDFIVTYFERYDMVKNQLPKGIKRFNQRLMKAFTQKMEEGSPAVYFITFLVALIVSATEFLCTGQAYLTAILHLIQSSTLVARGIALLLIYNIIFVLPLIVITIIAVKANSIMGVSIFMRERLHWIKLFNALVFLFILVYYLNQVLRIA
jgi:cytochrome c biogenesis protein CcdA/glutaredoxin